MSELYKDQGQYQDRQSNDYDAGALLEKEEKENELLEVAPLRDEIVLLKRAEADMYHSVHLQNVNPENLSVAALMWYREVKSLCDNLGIQIIGNQPEDLKIKIAQHKEAFADIKNKVRAWAFLMQEAKSGNDDIEFYAMLNNTLTVILICVQLAEAKLSRSMDKDINAKN